MPAPEASPGPAAPPLVGYAALSGAYAAAVGAGVLWLRRSGRRLPDRIAPGDIALVGVATFRLSRLVARGKVTSFLRAPFARDTGPAKAAEVQTQPKGEGPQRAVGELVTCPFCLAQWIATALAFAYVAAPRATRMAAAALTTATLADSLQYANKALQDR